MGKDGGTQMWCPGCKSLQICRVSTEESSDRGPRYYKKNPSIHTFRRPRECNSCGLFFWTDEISEDLTSQIVQRVDTFSETRQRINNFALEREWQQFHSLRNLILALVGEVGELAEVVQWKSDSEVEEMLEALEENTEFKKKLEEELADVFIYLTRIASISSIDLLESVGSKLDANATRYTVEKSKGNAEKR